MNISELTTKIFTLEMQLGELTNEHTNCVRAVGRAFSFTDNWRDKQSLALRIPHLAKRIESLNKEIEMLKSEREVYNKAAAYQKEVEEQKAKLKAKSEEEADKYAIGNPIALIEVE